MDDVNSNNKLSHSDSTRITFYADAFKVAAARSKCNAIRVAEACSWTPGTVSGGAASSIASQTTGSYRNEVFCGQNSTCSILTYLLEVV